MIELQKTQEMTERLEKLSGILRTILERSFLKPYHFETDTQGKIIKDEPYQESEIQNKNEWNEYKKEMNGIKTFVDKKCETLLTEISIASGWMKRSDLDKSFLEQRP
jgi:hypothetical protein